VDSATRPAITPRAVQLLRQAAVHAPLQRAANETGARRRPSASCDCGVPISLPAPP
jgi:hypothetical protein